MALLLSGNIARADSTFVVDTTSNANLTACTAAAADCSLSGAIILANSLSGTDTITFAIPSATDPGCNVGTGVCTIAPVASSLPTISAPLVIDGYTQAGASANSLASASNAVLKIELSGASAGIGRVGLTISGGSSTVRGLVINRFTRRGIELLTSGGNTIAGSYIGTNVAGTAVLANGTDNNGSTGGIRINGVANNIIGGSAPADRNLVSGNQSYGVVIDGVAGATANHIEGNLLGTDASGDVDLGGVGSTGVMIGRSGNYVGATTGTTATGPCTGACNVISGNNQGAVILGSNTNVIEGNFIGVNDLGSAAVPNDAGISLSGFSASVSGNRIGGTAAGARNVISGNGAGISLSGSFVTGNLIEGNFIGTGPSGIAALPNTSDGVSFTSSAASNTIGGTAPGAANTIAFNGTIGVTVTGAATTGNAVRHNSIHSNGGLGIDNVTGGNTVLAPPVITSAITKTGTACANCQIDVFSDASNEGRFYHGSTTANGSGNWTYTGGVTGPNMTATATDASGNTSEFSAAVAAPPAAEEFGGPASNSESPAAADEPVNLATGNYTYQSTDVDIAGVGLSLLFMRSYNSQDGASGRLGFGWQDNLRARLAFNNVDHSIADVTVTTETGRQDFYDRQLDASYLLPTGIFDTLTRNIGDGSFILRRKDRSEFHFNSTGVLTSMNDGNGNATTLTYTGNNLTSITDASSRTLTFTYDGSNRITTIVDSLSRTTTYTYDGAGNLASVTRAAAGTESYTYDVSHRLLTITDALGEVTTLVYDASGRATQHTNTASAVTVFGYASGQTIETDPAGCVTHHTYDSSFRETSRTDCVTGGVTNYTYDSAGNRTSQTDPLSHTTTYTYDARGNRLTMLDAASGTTTYTYNAQDDLLTQSDPLGHTTTYTYDSEGNRLTETDATSAVTTYTYNTAGQVLTQTDALGHVTTYTYDASGNQTSVSNALGHTTIYTYDAAGRRLTETDPLSNATTYTYDAQNRLITITDALSHTTSYAYDVNGNKTSETDANSKVTAYTYDEKNRLISVTDPASGVTGYTYDAVGNVTVVTDANSHTFTTAFDALRRVTSKTDAMGHVTTYSYDAMGNLISRTDANGVVTTYTYDSLNRLVSRIYSNGQATVTFTYDAAGRRTQMTDGTGTTLYVYDNLSRLTQVTFPGPRVVSYQYDAAGRRIKLIYPDAKEVNYVYDNADRLTSVTDWASRVTSYTYDSASRLVTTTRSNGVVSTNAYDAASQLTSIAQPGGNISYTLDNVGNRLTRTQGANTETYTYDNLYRLLAVQYAQGDCQAYTYDPVGNRLSLTTRAQVTVPCDGTPVATTYTYDAADRMTDTGPRPYTFDNNGNQVGSGNDLYVYDAENRLTAMRRAVPTTIPLVGSACADLNGDGTDNALDMSIMGKAFSKLRGQADFNFQADLNWDGTIDATDQGREAARFLQSCSGFNATYVYDGDGRRVSKTENGITTAYVWDTGSGLPVVLQDSAGTTYEYGTGLILQERLGTPQWYLADGLGSVTAITNAAGSVTDTYAYDVFGTVRQRTGTTENDFTYTGQQQDGSGLQYLRARHFDLNTGRFLQVDPAPRRLQSPSSASYVYSDNRPTTLTDPTGQLSLSPHYGNWCGQGGGGGLKDSLDGCCRSHDNCYNSCGVKGIWGVVGPSRCARACDAKLCWDSYFTWCGWNAKCWAFRQGVLQVFCANALRWRPY